MSDAIKQKSWPKRILWILLSFIVLLIVLVIVLRIFITTASGSRFIENQINKRSFGPVEAINVSGLSGDPLKAISIDRITVKDKNGEWLQIKNLEMKWKPFAFLKGHAWIEDLKLETTDVLRKPVLNASTSKSTNNKPLPKVTLENYALGAVNLNAALAGQNLSFTSSGELITESNGAVSAILKAVRLDEAGDALDLNFTRTRLGMMTGVFEIKGAAGGPIASLLKAPDVVTGTGKISGSDTVGSGTSNVAFGSEETVSAYVNWTRSAIIAKANINVGNWPVFNAGGMELGSNLVSILKLDRNDEKAFSAALKTSQLSLEAQGNLPADGFVPATFNVNINADKVSKLITLPDGYDIGRASIEGRVDMAASYGFDGRIMVTDLKIPHGSAADITGPLSVSQTGDGQYGFKTDFNATDVMPTAKLPVDLAPKTQLKSSGSFDVKESRLSLKSLALTSGANQVTGKGTLTTDGQNLDVTVKGATAIKALGSIPDGILKADIAIRKTPNSLLAVTADGAFRPSSAVADPIGELIGEQIAFKAQMSPTDNGLKISEVSVVGDNLRAALTGTLNEQLNLIGEAVLSAPVDVKSIMIDGGAEASFTVMGSRAAPALRLDSKVGSITAQNYVLKDARLRTEITDILSAPKGPIQIDAQTEHGPLSVSTQFASTPDAYIANDIELAWGRLTASGDVKLPTGNIATGKINLNLPEREGQYARAALTLSNASGKQGVELTAEAEQIAFAGFELDMVSANANGTLTSLQGAVKAKGQRGENLISRSFEIDAPFTLAKYSAEGRDENVDKGFKATLSPQLKYGDIAVTTQTPIIATYASGEISLTAPLAVSGGTVELVYKRSAAEEHFKLDAKLLPVSLIPMPGSLADTRGQISADIDFSAPAGSPLQGGATVSLTDWRGFNVDKDSGITSSLRTVINGSQADTVLTASSLSGFKVDGEIGLPLLLTETLTQTRLNMGAPIHGKFSASGAAASIFGLLTPSDSELGGELSANITIAGTLATPSIEGEARGADMRFEMPELGTRIRDGRMTAKFTNDSLSVSDLYVADADDGTLTGLGEFKLGELGRPIGELNITANHFRALDRGDVDAKVKGSLKFVSRPKDATLSGDIIINNVEVKEFVSGSVSVIEIEVDEINRADQEDEIIIKKPAAPINFDISIKAPRKIYVRSRGIDVEMAINAKIQGTATEPLFYGEAKVVRGGYKLAGKTLEFENGTIIFDGDLTTAQVDFKAVTETQNIEAVVTIKGTVQKPKIELSSTPERPQDEILSALLFGRSASELSAIEAAQLAGALAQFSGVGGGFDLLGGVRDAIGINQLNLTVNADGQAQLVGGRYLAKNVYLEIFSGAGPDQTGAIIDWEIRKNIALRSRIRADNDQGLSLKWKKDF